MPEGYRPRKEDALNLIRADIEQVQDELAGLQLQIHGGEVAEEDTRHRVAELEDRLDTLRQERDSYRN